MAEGLFVVMACPTCGTELTPKSKILLIAVGGVALVATAFLPLLSRWLFAVVLPACVVGAYLIVWATNGRALWCRSCKKAPYL